MPSYSVTNVTFLSNTQQTHSSISICLLNIFNLFFNDELGELWVLHILISTSSVVDVYPQLWLPCTWTKLLAPPRALGAGRLAIPTISTPNSECVFHGDNMMEAPLNSTVGYLLVKSASVTWPGVLPTLDHVTSQEEHTSCILNSKFQTHC